MIDFRTSPNDTPMWALAHAYVIKRQMEWMEMRAELRGQAWHYPVRGGSLPTRNGTNLYEAVTSGWPFELADVGLAAAGETGAQSLTHADVVCWLLGPGSFVRYE